MIINKNSIIKNKLFYATVLIPTIASIVYFGLVAKDIYVCESKFVVKSPEKQSISPFGMALQDAGLIKSQEDSFVVKEYTLSKDAQIELDRNLSIKKYFSTHGDLLSSFDNIKTKYFGSDEMFHKYYKDFVVDEIIEPTSGVSTLTTRAFDADMATSINKKLLEQSEAFVNTLNKRARKDTVDVAQQEVDRAFIQAKEASNNVAIFRTKEGVFDPEKQTEVYVQLVAKLQEDLITTQSQLEELISISPENSQVVLLKKRIDLIKKQIVAKNNEITGGAKSLATKADGYDNLTVTQQYAEKQLAAALANLEQAKNEAGHKQMYIERIEEPLKPDVAVEPKRLKNIAVVFFFGLLIFGIVTIVKNGFIEHAD